MGAEASLEDVFRHHTGDTLEAGGDTRHVRQTRRTASRLPSSATTGALRRPLESAWRRSGSRVATLCLVELQKLRHDRKELYTRAIQPALWLLIFGETFSLQIIWERDAGVLAKLMATPTPRWALVAGKAFAAGVRALVQGVVVLVLAAVQGVGLTDNPCG